MPKGAVQKPPSPIGHTLDGEPQPDSPTHLRTKNKITYTLEEPRDRPPKNTNQTPTIRV